MKVSEKDAKVFSHDAKSVLMLHEQLVHYAKLGKVVAYDTLATDVGLHLYDSKYVKNEYSYKLANHREQYGWLLNAISDYSLASHKILLSALVVRKDDGIPGEGFFYMVDSMGLFTGDRKEAAAKKFVNNEQKKVYKYYKNS